MAGDHGSQGPVVIGVCIAFAILTFIVLSLRLFARIYVLGKMGLDDYLIIAASLLSWAFIAATIAAVQNGLGQHYEYTDKSKSIDYSFAVWLSSMFYLATLGFVKTSALWFYTRLGDRTLTRISYVMILPVPTHQYGLDRHCPGKCVNINVFYLANAALNIFTDLLTYTLPIRVILKLQMPRKQKIVLGFILCLGLFACVSSIIRITYIPAMLTSADYTYAISGAMYWSVIESNVGILAASIPSFKAIASRFVPRFIGEYSSGRKSYGPWSSTAAARRYGSGFAKVTDPAHITMNTLNGDKDATIGTQIGAIADNSSEERIIVPDGKIFTQTEIETTVESTGPLDLIGGRVRQSKRSFWG
ncbi:uncharacterized protein N7477_002462 [Penicillium maclennaniae]|uniref:uncharacterized protein n=1 Tax=Penicillium maclennaniae TaxID=1343394 RepID=UPI00253FB04A|nr:uncharacterized protein N7477_002462 [Penicillium maclennaniae]KAJ5676829.1 hypothetical protein N7477_002462 [Penicillium maclennaniae]